MLHIFSPSTWPQVANKVADAAGQVTRKYFRHSPSMSSIKLELKEDESPVTIADK